ncbi:MAG: hypothetical protein II794_00335 [Oscillospiraceae bacterium]|nr:hypothetical protein [Oscillospiraceae bacterium]
MEAVLKGAALAVLGAVLALSIKKESPAISLLLAAACAVLLLTLALPPLTEGVNTMLELSREAGISYTALGAVLKSLGIAVVTRLGADTLKEAGLLAASSALELLGACAALAVSLPLIDAVLELIRSLV